MAIKRTRQPRRKAPVSGGQLRRMCGAMCVHHRLLETDPSFRTRQVRLEQWTSRRRAAASSLKAAPLVTIPVVVHVVFKTDEQKISPKQVASQIRVLNRDFGAKNPDRAKAPAVWKGLVTDARVRFRLAKKAPDGSKTPGIAYTHTRRASFTDDDAVKFTAQGGIDIWNPKMYLNIWVCNLQPYLGYAQFPGGPAKTDGVVILYTAFGTTGTAAAPFNRGRTATHEVGHWLNLRHIWADT